MLIIKFVVAIAVVTVLVGEERSKTVPSPALVSVDEYGIVTLSVVGAGSRVFPVSIDRLLITLPADQIRLLSKILGVLFEFFPADDTDFLLFTLGEFDHDRHVTVAAIESRCPGFAVDNTRAIAEAAVAIHGVTVGSKTI